MYMDKRYVIYLPAKWAEVEEDNIDDILIECQQDKTWNKYWQDNEHEFILDGLIIKIQTKKCDVIIVPKETQIPLMLQYHDGALGGHLSSLKTLSRLSSKYYWRTMKEDVKQWCQVCRICQTRRNTGKKARVPLKPLPPPAAPMEMTAMDIVGPLPLSCARNKYILVFCDYLTRWPEAYAIPNHKADTVARVFVEQIVFRYGVPKKLLTDRGTDFLSDLLKGINDYLDRKSNV